MHFVRGLLPVAEPSTLEKLVSPQILQAVLLIVARPMADDEGSFPRHVWVSCISVASLDQAPWKGWVEVRRSVNESDHLNGTTTSDEYISILQERYVKTLCLAKPQTFAV